MSHMHEQRCNHFRTSRSSLDWLHYCLRLAIFAFVVLATVADFFDSRMGGKDEAFLLGTPSTTTTMTNNPSYSSFSFFVSAETRDEKIKRMNDLLKRQRIERARREENENSEQKEQRNVDGVETPQLNINSNSDDDVQNSHNKKDSRKEEDSRDSIEQQKDGAAAVDDINDDDLKNFELPSSTAHIDSKIHYLGGKKKALKADIERLQKTIFAVDDAKSGRGRGGAFYPSRGVLSAPMPSRRKNGIIDTIRNTLVRAYFYLFDIVTAPSSSSSSPSSTATGAGMDRSSEHYFITSLRVKLDGDSDGNSWLSRLKRTVQRSVGRRSEEGVFSSASGGELVWEEAESEEAMTRDDSTNDSRQAGDLSADANSGKSSGSSQMIITPLPFFAPLRFVWLLPGKVLHFIAVTDFSRLGEDILSFFSMFRSDGTRNALSSSPDGGDTLTEDVAPQTAPLAIQQRKRPRQQNHHRFVRVVPSFFGASVTEEKLNLARPNHRGAQLGNDDNTDEYASPSKGEEETANREGGRSFHPLTTATVSSESGRGGVGSLTEDDKRIAELLRLAGASNDDGDDDDTLSREDGGVGSSLLQNNDHQTVKKSHKHGSRRQQRQIVRNRLIPSTILLEIASPLGGLSFAHFTFLIIALPSLSVIFFTFILYGKWGGVAREDVEALVEDAQNTFDKIHQWKEEMMRKGRSFEDDSSSDESDEDKEDAESSNPSPSSSGSPTSLLASPSSTSKFIDTSRVFNATTSPNTSPPLKGIDDPNGVDESHPRGRRPLLSALEAMKRDDDNEMEKKNQKDKKQPSNASAALISQTKTNRDQHGGYAKSPSPSSSPLFSPHHIHQLLMNLLETEDDLLVHRQLRMYVVFFMFAFAYLVYTAFSVVEMSQKGLAHGLLSFILGDKFVNVVVFGGVFLLFSGTLATLCVGFHHAFTALNLSASGMMITPRYGSEFPGAGDQKEEMPRAERRSPPPPTAPRNSSLRKRSQSPAFRLRSINRK